MTADEQTESLGNGGDAAAGPRRLYDTGARLLALSLAAEGLSGLARGWEANTGSASLIAETSFAVVCVALVAGAAGIAVVRKWRIWGACLALAALVAYIPLNTGLGTDQPLLKMRALLEGVAVGGALLLLAGTKRLGQRILAIAALVCVAAEGEVCRFWRSGIDAFYGNYDVVTLANSIWAWNRPLGCFFGVCALAGAAGMLLRQTARCGAICLAAASGLFLPLWALYRLDDFCGMRPAPIGLLLTWTLDLGVAGGALIVAAEFERTGAARGKQRRWLRGALWLVAVTLLLGVVLHGLTPTLFYLTNSRGDAKLGQMTARVYAAMYDREAADFRVAEPIMKAGQAGRKCAAGDPHGCAEFGDFYRGLGWNWGRRWALYARAAHIFGERCESGDAEACYELGAQYEAGGEGVPMDSRQAAAQFEKACDGNSGAGCEKLGEAYTYGLGVKKDESRGAALTKKGCALGNDWACTRLKYSN